MFFNASQFVQNSKGFDRFYIDKKDRNRNKK